MCLFMPGELTPYNRCDPEVIINTALQIDGRLAAAFAPVV
jgi:hypothetical protein